MAALFEELQEGGPDLVGSHGSILLASGLGFRLPVSGFGLLGRRPSSQRREHEVGIESLTGEVSIEALEVRTVGDVLAVPKASVQRRLDERFRIEIAIDGVDGTLR